MGKIIDFFFQSNDYNKTVCAKIVMTNDFCIESWQEFSSLIFLCKERGKNDFPKHIDRRTG